MWTVMQNTQNTNTFDFFLKKATEILSKKAILQKADSKPNLNTELPYKVTLCLLFMFSVLRFYLDNHRYHIHIC